MNFGVRKFHSFLLVGSFSILMSVLVSMANGVIAGHLIGANAFAGINLVEFVCSAISFFASLVATGMATNYSIAMGRLDRASAHRFFAQAIWTALIFGGALALAIFFSRSALLSFLNADAAVTQAAESYLRLIGIVAVLQPISTILCYLGYIDGNSRLCVFAYIGQFIANVLVSVATVLCGLGTAGCAIGTIASYAIVIAIMSFHFRSKRNSCRFVRHFSLRDSWRIAQASFGDSVAFLCESILFLSLSKIVISRFGSGPLPILGVVIVMWRLVHVCDGVGNALQPFVTVYYAEGNVKSVRDVTRSAIRIVLAEGVFLSGLLSLWPELVLALVGLSDSAIVKECCMAVRLVAILMPPLALAGVFNSYYMFIEKPLFAGIVTFACYLGLPVMAFGIGSSFGIHPAWFSLGLGPGIGCIVSFAVIVFCVGMTRFPFLIERSREENLFVRGIVLSETEIVSASCQIADVLKKRKTNETIVSRVALMVEEVLLAVKDHNREHKVLGEIVLDLNHGVTLTLRDDGEIFDITDSDRSVSSLRSYLVARVMEQQPGRVNIVTTGFNRNVFKF